MSHSTLGLLYALAVGVVALLVGVAVLFRSALFGLLRGRDAAESPPTVPSEAPAPAATSFEAPVSSETAIPVSAPVPPESHEPESPRPESPELGLRRDRQLSIGVFGYAKSGVDQLLAEVDASYAAVRVERVELAVRVEELEAELARRAEREGLLRSTLISAERIAHDARDRARREADAILGEAQATARVAAREALAENERLDGKSRRTVALLRSALAAVEEILTDEPVAEEARASTTFDGVGNREDLAADLIGEIAG